MKIAHINNISGVSTTIAEEQRKVGHHVNVFTFNKISHLHFGGEKFNYYSPFSRIKFFKTINNHDLWHYHYPYGSLKKKIEKKVNNKIYIKHYHGDDIRGKNDNDMCIVCTPDLLQFTPNGIWIPNPVDLEFLDKYKNNETKNVDPKKINIAHYPYYKNQKKNQPDVEKDISEILKDVSKKYNCEIVNIFKLPYHVAISMLSQCDIVIGKILNKIGWFGKLELEGMFLGKSVIGYISDHLYDKYKPPVYRTSSKTLIQDLETLIEDYSIRKKLSNEGPAYVKSNHSKQYVMSLLDKYYEKFDNKK
jgi:hypothetical protein